MIGMIDLLKKNGPYFKANLHCHTTLVAPSLQDTAKYDLTISWGAQIVCHDDPYFMLEHLRKKGLRST